MNNPLLYAAMVRQPSLGAITSAKLYAWGDNQYGQLGDGTTTDKLTPALVSESDWASVSCGTYFTHAIRSDGLLFACGLNQFGAIGDGTQLTRATLTQIGSSAWQKVSLGPMRTHTLAIRDDGKLFAWGRNHVGQIGDGTFIDRYSPVQIGTGSWLEVAAGAVHSLAIREDGKLFAWGGNSSGQLGDGTGSTRSSPTQIGTSTWKYVAAGDEYSVAIRDDGVMFSFGRNDFGQLGDMTNTIRFSPVAVSSPNPNIAWLSVACGQAHTIAFTRYGLDTVYAWGRGGQGQLGLSTVNDRTSPSSVGSSFSKVAAGAYHTLIIGQNDKLNAAGYNLAGQLGDGTSNNRFSLVQVGTRNWRSVAGGALHSVGIAAS